MPSKDSTSRDFTSYYLQQSTKEFAEDLDKIRNADDFKGDAVAMLVKSLQQGNGYAVSQINHPNYACIQDYVRYIQQP